VTASIAVLTDQYLAEERSRLALFVTADIIVVTVLVWLSARKMKEEHYRRSRAEVELRELITGLEGRGARRTEALVQQAAVLAEQAALLDHAQDVITVRGMGNRIVFWNRGHVLRTPADVVSVGSIEVARRAPAADCVDLAMLDIFLSTASDLDPLPDLCDSRDDSIPVIIFASQGGGLVCDEWVQVALPKSQASLDNLVATIRDRSAYPPMRTSKEAP